MTNTSDFRRYSYQNDPTYLIKNFDLSRGSQAPKVLPEENVKSRFTVRENTRVKSRAELNTEQKLARKQAIMVFAVAALCIVLIAGVISSFAVKNEYTRTLASQQVDIANAVSENISLQSKLEAMVSISMIDEYAVEKLGMTKVKSNQIQYMDVEQYKLNRQEELAKQAQAKAAAQKKAPTKSSNK